MAYFCVKFAFQAGCRHSILLLAKLVALRAVLCTFKTFPESFVRMTKKWVWWVFFMFKILHYTTGIMPFALRASIAVQFVPDKLVVQDDSKTLVIVVVFWHRGMHSSLASSVIAPALPYYRPTMYIYTAALVHPCTSSYSVFPYTSPLTWLFQKVFSAPTGDVTVC